MEYLHLAGLVIRGIQSPTSVEHEPTGALKNLRVSGTWFDCSQQVSLRGMHKNAPSLRIRDVNPTLLIDGDTLQSVDLAVERRRHIPFGQKLWPADTFVDFEHSLYSAVRKPKNGRVQRRAGLRQNRT
jgi:hypothetical protein